MQKSHSYILMEKMKVPSLKLALYFIKKKKEIIFTEIERKNPSKKCPNSNTLYASLSSEASRSLDPNSKENRIHSFKFTRSGDSMISHRDHKQRRALFNVICQAFKHEKQYNTIDFLTLTVILHTTVKSNYILGTNP